MFPSVKVFLALCVLSTATAVVAAPNPWVLVREEGDTKIYAVLSQPNTEEGYRHITTRHVINEQDDGSAEVELIADVVVDCAQSRVKILSVTMDVEGTPKQLKVDPSWQAEDLSKPAQRVMLEQVCLSGPHTPQ